MSTASGVQHIWYHTVNVHLCCGQLDYALHPEDEKDLVSMYSPPLLLTDWSHFSLSGGWEGEGADPIMWRK